MRRTDIAEAQTVAVAIRGVVVDRMTFPAGDRAEEYKANVRRWALEKRIALTIWTQTAAAGRAAEAGRRGTIALAV